MRRLAFCVLASIPVVALLLCDIPAAPLPAADDHEVRAFLERPQPPAPPQAEPLPPAPPQAEPPTPTPPIWGPLPKPAAPADLTPRIDRIAHEFLELRVESIMHGRIPIAKISGRLYRAGDFVDHVGVIIAIQDRDVEFEVADSVLACSQSGGVRIIKDGETAQRIMQLRAEREADAEAAGLPN